MAYLWLILSAVCSVFASIALKLAAANSINRALPAFSLHELFHYGIAVATYGLGFILYALALRRLDLSIAYPMMVAIAVVGVMSYGLLFGDENITIARMIGAFCIVFGVFLINR